MPDTLNTYVSRLNASDGVDLPVSRENPLFVVGPNGSGKSGLLHFLYRKNDEKAVRITASRPIIFENDLPSFSPAERKDQEAQLVQWDRDMQGRWRDPFSAKRVELLFANLIEAENDLARRVRNACRANDTDKIYELSKEASPLETINEIAASVGMNFELYINKGGSIFVRKEGVEPYSAMKLSDGERALIIISGIILTSDKDSLILIDEPERHFYNTIVSPLLLQLFSRRSDCFFIISTHDLRLPAVFPDSHVVRVRDYAVDEETQKKGLSGVINKWDFDIIPPGEEIDESLREEINGARRKVVFIEGSETSLDKHLYEILFPDLSIFSRETCSSVKHAVRCIRDMKGISWIRAYGIIDQDQLSESEKTKLIEGGVFPLSVYSVEAFYYDWEVIKVVAEQKAQALGNDAAQMVCKARKKFLNAVLPDKERLAARMIERSIRSELMSKLPKWRDIYSRECKSIHPVNICIDIQPHYEEEVKKIERLIYNEDVVSIMRDYPVRETQALQGIFSALGFSRRLDYESAVLNVIKENNELRRILIGYFGDFPQSVGCGV